jgi:hypothetical protein
MQENKSSSNLYLIFLHLSLFKTFLSKYYQFNNPIPIVKGNISGPRPLLKKVEK